MAVVVVGFNVVVVVLPVFRARVVGRININGVYPAAMGIGQGLEGMVVLPVDDTPAKAGYL